MNSKVYIVQRKDGQGGWEDYSIPFATRERAEEWWGYEPRCRIVLVYLDRRTDRTVRVCR